MTPTRIGGRRTRLRRLTRAALLLVPVALATTSLVGVQSSRATEGTPARVSVDFGAEQGALLHTERFNNFHTTSVFTAQRPGDVAYLNEQGMHGDIYRVWLNSPNEESVPPCEEDISTPPAAEKPCTLNPPFEAYLSDADDVAEAILGNLRLDGTPGFITEGGPAAAEPLIERILLAIKKAHPKFAYVEAWNEPDAPGSVIKASEVYEYYVPVYRAVNDINAALGESDPSYVPIKVGGPTLYHFHEEWLETFLDDYKADPDPAKRLDFISYHAYLDRVNGANVFYKSNPSLVEGQRAALDRMLEERGLDTNIPSYVSETGVYPGPLCDKCDRTDFLRTAAGMASLQYWLTNEGKTYPFSWLTRQRAGGLKDQFVTRNPTGPYRDPSNPLRQLWPPLDPIPPSTFTPFGNMLLMKSKMKDTHVEASSDSLTKGIGVYAVASKDKTGASLMVWNYQGCSGPPATVCPTASYRTTVDMANLPANLRHRPVRQKLFRIDQNTSNYYGDPARADLQQVASTIVTTRASYSETVDLDPNALYLIVLEPTTPPSKDACKDGGWRNHVDDDWEDFDNQGDCVSWVNHHG